MSNTSNVITVLQNIQTLVTNVEAGNLQTGIPEIDAQTRALLATPIAPFLAAVFDNGSRAQQNAVAQARAAANNGAVPAQDPLYTQFDAHMRAIAAQIAVLQSPTSVPRRAHPPLK